MRGRLMIPVQFFVLIMNGKARGRERERGRERRTAIERNSNFAFVVFVERRSFGRARWMYVTRTFERKNHFTRESNRPLRVPVKRSNLDESHAVRNSEL